MTTSQEGAIPSGSTPGPNPFLRITNNDTLMQRDKDAEMHRQAVEANAQPEIVGLAGHVWKCWIAARMSKMPVIQRLLDAQRARVGKYDQNVLAEIRKFGGSEEYARITANKCRVAESWLRDVFLGQTEKPWTLDADPEPKLAPDIMMSIDQQVGEEFAALYAAGAPVSADVLKERAEELKDAQDQRILDEAREISARMEKEMHSQMIEGDWVPAMGDFLSDLVTYPAAHFKAPVLRRKQQISWQSKDGQWVPEASDNITPMFERVDPYKIFPAPGIQNPQQGYMIEHIQFTRDDLYSLIGVEGFSEPAIRAVLEQFGRGGLYDWINRTEIIMRAAINGEQVSYLYQNPHVTIDCLEFHGPVQGRQLVEWGMDISEIDDPDKDYEARVWLISTWVIKAELNFDPMGRRPYYKTSYEEVPGAYWGYGLVDILQDVQGIANAALRAMVNNMGMASGPMVGINVDRLPPGEDVTNLHPWKIFQFNDSLVGSTLPALQFFQPDTRVDENLKVIEQAYKFADDFSLIPRYMAGNDKVGGPGRTASGLSMLMDAANKGLKGVVSNIDVKIMTPMLESLFNYNMLYNPDPSIKGAANVVARGAVSLMQLESLQLRRNEFLNATNNPTDNQILGLAGRSEILRQTAKDLQLDVDRVIPPREKFQQSTGQGTPVGAAPGQPPQQGQPPSATGETLSNGASTTDNFSPNNMRSTG